MIELTIKTLDSENHQFSLDDETTVAQLKRQIREQMGIEFRMQRLIFCGRVLTDEQRLADIGVHEKVIHLVPRPPPSPMSRNPAYGYRQEMREAFQEAQRVMNRMSSHPSSTTTRSRETPMRHLSNLDPPSELALEHQHALMSTPTANRLEFIRRIIDDIYNSLRSLFTQMSNIYGSVETEPELFDGPITALGASLQEFRRQHGQIYPPRPRSTPGSRPCLSRPRDFAELINELDELQQDFAPYRNYYMTILRDTHTDQLTELDRATRQQIVELVSDILHSFAHAYHAASDISVTIGEFYPQLSSGSGANRHQMPLQTQINVVQTSRRPEGNAAGSASASSSADGTPTNPTPTRAQPQTPLAASQRHAAGERPSPIHTGTNSSQAGTPEPVTYQVEIETRVPIAFPIDNALINGLAAVATNIQQAQNETQAGQAQAQNQSQDQEDRPRVLSDIENLLRTLSQAHPGMEVVMSMEQIHSLGSPPSLSPTSQESDGGASITISPTYAFTTLPQPFDGRLIAAYGNTPSTAGRPSARATGNTARAAAGARNPAGVFGTSVAGATAGASAGATRATGQSSAPNAGRGRGAGHGAGNPCPHVTFGSTPFGSTFPGIHAGTTISIGPDGMSTSTPGVGGVSVSALGPTSLTIQPDGEVFLAPMTGDNNGIAGDILQNMFTSMFRTNAPATTGDANTPPTSQATGSSGNAATVTNNSTGNSSRTSATNPTPGDNNLARRIAAMTAPAFNNPSNSANASGRTSDGGWGFGNSLVYLENILPVQQERLQSQSVMNRARSLHQQAENRRRRHENNAHPLIVQERIRQSHNNARTHYIALACMSYDRYLPCDSSHARQRLSDRRANYQRRHVAQMRQRARRQTAPDIDCLQDRNVHFTTRHIAIMMRLLSGPVSVEGQMNAFMVTVARVLYLEPDSRPRSYDPFEMPREFLFIRMQMREYIQSILQSVIDTNGTSCDAVTIRILNSVRPFLEQIETITPVDSVTPVVSVVRAWLLMRMPAIIACVMSETATDMFVSRFYGVFARFFTDLCALFIQMLRHGWEALCLIYSMFIDQIVDYFESSAGDWLRLLARENLMMIRSTIDPQSPINFYSHYRYDGSSRARVCCLYRASQMTEMYRLTPGDLRLVPHICEYHQRQTMPLTTPPLLGPRNDTPDTVESLPSMSIPTMSSGSSETSGSPAPEDEPEGEASNEGSPPLEEEEPEACSGADTVSTTSHNSKQRSPVETRSAATSPKHDTPDTAQQDVPNEDNEEGRQEEARARPLSQDQSHASSPRSSPDSMRFVPPVMILEHWGPEWMPVFTRDQRAQRDRPQEPHSDAYLSGMPSRKRRCVRSTRPPTTLDGFMTESVREATGRAASLDQAQLRSVIRDQVRSLVRTRAETSEDYDPVRYPSAARFLDQTKQKKKESETKTEKD